jgi:small subunit ribosomal protein S2
MNTNQKDSNIVSELFKVGAHFGFVRARRHPSVKPYIFGVKNRIEIFDLEKTNEALQAALEFIKNLGSTGSTILFVGGKGEARFAVKAAAESLDMPYVDGRWIGGTLTNFPQIKKRVAKLQDLTTQKEKGELAKYTKRERMLIDKEIENLKRFFEGLIPMKELPKALFVVDSRKEDIAVREARDKGIPVIALCGSDCDITLVDYAIPANDASVASIKFFMEKVGQAYEAGKSTIKK